MPGAAKQTTKQSSIALYGRLLSYLQPLVLAVLVALIGFILFAASEVWFAELIGRMVDSIESGTGVSAYDRLNIPLVLIGIVAARGFGGFLGSYYMAYIANKVVHRLRCQITERFLVLPNSFYDQNSNGHLMSIVTFNVLQVSRAVSDALKTIVREGSKVIYFTISLFLLNWMLTLIFLAVMPIIALVVLYASKKFRKHSKRIQKSMGDVTHIISETIKGLKVIRTFGAEKQVRTNFMEASKLNLKQNMKLTAVSSISTPIIQILVGSALALIIWFAMSPTVLAEGTAGEFVTFITLAGLLLKPIRQLSNVNADIQKGLAAAESVFELLDRESEKDTGTQTVARVKGEVSFKAVAFSYPPTGGVESGGGAGSAENTESTVKGKSSDTVLNDISFTCKPGQTIAIVGKSGSGKSTLVNLIPRFYEMDEGEISIDGIALQNFTLHNLRQQIALVSQQVVLFNGSIRDNIAYGDLAAASDDEINAALQNANALEFIDSLPDGINTLVGDDGTLLSGGQRQRLAIARALLKDAPILILDEATSALDSASERYIQSALDKLMKNRSTFVIAHRLSTIENADIIMVMHEGQIVEMGNHQNLLELNKYYAELHQLQFSDS